MVTEPPGTEPEPVTTKGNEEPDTETPKARSAESNGPTGRS
jgi:hypothetical protein